MPPVVRLSLALGGQAMTYSVNSLIPSSVAIPIVSAPFYTCTNVVGEVEGEVGGCLPSFVAFVLSCLVLDAGE